MGQGMVPARGSRARRAPPSGDFVQELLIEYDSGEQCHFRLSGAASDVEVSLLDTLGRQLRRITSGYYSAGDHSVNFSREGIPPGAYVCQVRIGAFRVSRKVLFM